MSVVALSGASSPLRFCRKKTLGPRISVEIVFLKNRTLSPAVQSFINCTRGVAKSLFAYLDQPNNRASGRSQNERLWSGRFWRKADVQEAAPLPPAKRGQNMRLGLKGKLDAL